MNPLSIQDILDATGARLVQGQVTDLVTGVSTDTRNLGGGELFVALSGPNFDGNAFAAEAVRGGAAALILRATAELRTAPALQKLRSKLPEGMPLLMHEAPRRALSEIASHYRSRLKGHVLGITGSCGKTSTKNMLATLLSPISNTIASPNSFNNDIGVPHTLFLADDTTENLIVEMGTNSPGEIAALARTAKPDAGIITNVGASHLEGLNSIEGVAQEKGELAASLPREGFCVLNADCRFTPQIRRRTAARVVTFGVAGKGDLVAEDVWFHAGGTTFRLRGQEITSPLLGLHNVQNLLAAFAACEGMGYTLEQILPNVARLETESRRMERIDLDGVTLYDDSYNANPESARASVRVLCGLHGHRRRILMLGDMLELGDLAAELHHSVGKEAALAGVDVLVLVGELTRATAAGALEGGLAPESVLHCASREEATRVLMETMSEGDVVLVKGSRATGLDQVVSSLQESKSESRAR